MVAFFPRQQDTSDAARDVLVEYHDRILDTSWDKGDGWLGRKFIERARAGEQVEGAEYFIGMVVAVDQRDEVKRRFHADVRAAQKRCVLVGSEATE